jgi:transposase
LLNYKNWCRIWHENLGGLKMPKTTKLIDQEIVDRASKELSNLKNIKNLKDVGVVSIRLRAIIAAFTCGIKIVSEVFNINRSSLHRWVSLYRNSGLEGLKNIKKPPRSKLNQEQQSQFKEWVEKDNTLTIKKLGIMIEERFGFKLSRSSIHVLLGKLGFSHITGRTRHYKANKVDQEEFKKKSADKSSK